MVVPLQLILGIFLASVLHSHAKTIHVRHIRDTVFPLLLSNQNSSEKFNHRDINKIKVEPPKTDLIENINNEDKINVNKINLDTHSIKANNSENESSKERKQEKIKKKSDVEKEIDKLETGRSIDSDTSKFWSSDFHNKNNVFTLSSSGGNQKFFHDDEDDTLIEPSIPSTTFSVLSEIHSELTTPKTQFFDKKFKEAVDSIEQNLDDDETDDFLENDEGFKPETFLKDRKNGTLDYIKTKSVINNETVDKNALHKDVDVEEARILNFEKVYNDTTSYDTSIEEPKTSNSTDKSGITTTSRTLIKSDKDKTNSYILDNQIENETVKSIVSTTVKYLDNELSTTTFNKDLLEPIEHNIIPLQLSESSKDQKSSFSDSKSVAAQIPEVSTENNTTTVKILENISEKSVNESTTVIDIESTSGKATESIVEASEDDKEQNMDSTTAKILEITSEKATDASDIREIVSNTSENSLTTTEKTLNEKAILTSEISVSSTTDSPDTTTIIQERTTGEETTTNKDKTTVNENSTTISETTTHAFVEDKHREEKLLETTTELDTTTGFSTIIVTSSTNEPDNTIPINAEKETTETTENRELTTLNIDETTITNSTEKARIIEETTTLKNLMLQNRTTEELTTIEPTTILSTTFSSTTVMGENISKTTEDITESKTTPFTEFTTETAITNRHQERLTLPTNPEPTTTEFVAVYINNEEENHTTVTPITLGSNLDPINDSKSNNSIVEFKKIDLNVNTNISTESTETTEEGSTEHNPGELTNDTGKNKSTIAAIAISTVGAICLILLGVLLYVMRKRQKRFKYGPRCTPVSLDEYSIDNLSVYNSVRMRKGKDRTSKRSFGNPAFEDPSGVSHPLNYPALSKFSANTEDINAEFEDVPQIHARASELPEGCDSKNRYANVIPLPETRVFLKPIEGVPNSDYINANYVTGPKNVRGYYIATQGPMQNTVDDFWRMIWEQQAKVVLMMTHLIENGLEKCVDYLPESEIVDNHRLFGDFQVTLKKREVKDKYIISSLQLKNMVSNSWREITHFWYLGWPEKGVPDEANSLIAFLIEARSYMKTATIDKRNDPNSAFQNGGPSNEHNPVVIHCSPGTGRTGVVIACDIAIREFETTRLVDIPKIVYKIRRDRANSVQSKEQYQFIYKVVSLYATKLTGGQFLKE